MVYNYDYKEGLSMQNTDTDRVNSRIDSTIKLKAQAELKKNGLTISEYIRIILTGVAEHGLPENFAMPSTDVNQAILEMVDAKAQHQSLPGGDSKAAFERTLK
ncbi:hypothetical protein LZ395_11655 [Levilactobacillus zymae]|nr:hypothetical protein LZ395_11655 [Levilactobacillus zymae]